MAHAWPITAMPMLCLRLGVENADLFSGNPSLIVRLTAELDTTARRLADRFPCIGTLANSYDSLTGADLVFFDESVALLTAARLLVPVTTGGANSDLSGIRNASDNQFTFAPPGTDGGERGRWISESAEAIGRVACVKAGYQARAGSFSMFTVSGPTRVAAAAGVHNTLMSVLIRLLSDSADADLFSDNSPDPVSYPDLP